MTLQSRFFNSPARELDQALTSSTASNTARVASTGKPVAVSTTQSPSAEPIATSSLHHQTANPPAPAA